MTLLLYLDILLINSFKLYSSIMTDVNAPDNSTILENSHLGGCPPCRGKFTAPLLCMNIFLSLIFSKRLVIFSPSKNILANLLMVRKLLVYFPAITSCLRRGECRVTWSGRELYRSRVRLNRRRHGGAWQELNPWCFDGRCLDCNNLRDIRT